MSPIPSSLSTGSPELTQDFTVESSDWWLWGLVAIGFVLDVGLTSYGLNIGLQESNPFVRPLFPILGVLPTLFLLKGFVVAVGLTTWTYLPRRYRPVIPLGMALPWLVASGINVGLILSV